MLTWDFKPSPYLTILFTHKSSINTKLLLQKMRTPPGKTILTEVTSSDSSLQEFMVKRTFKPINADNWHQVVYCSRYMTPKTTYFPRDTPRAGDSVFLVTSDYRVFRRLVESFSWANVASLYRNLRQKDFYALLETHPVRLDPKWAAMVWKLYSHQVDTLCEFLLLPFGTDFPDVADRQYLIEKLGDPLFDSTRFLISMLTSTSSTIRGIDATVSGYLQKIHTHNLGVMKTITTPSDFHETVMDIWSLRTYRYRSLTSEGTPPRYRYLLPYLPQIREIPMDNILLMSLVQSNTLEGFVLGYFASLRDRVPVKA